MWDPERGCHLRRVGNTTIIERLKNRLIESANAPRKAAKPPGPILLVFTTIAAVTWVCVSRNWWPSPYGQFAWFDPLLAGASSILVLLIVGLIWAIRTLHVVGQDRRWSWWIAPAPVVVGLAAAVLVLLPPENMLDHRDEFEAVARELSAQPSSSREHIEIGPFDISSARATSGGEVYFTEDGGFSLMSASGWAYAPGGPPAGFDDFTATHLDGPWYEFSAIWRD